MTFASGLASGVLSSALLGLVGFVLTGRTLSNKADIGRALLDDAEQILNNHLVPLVKALDLHGMALVRHQRAMDRSTGAIGTHMTATTGMVGPATTAMPTPAPAAPVPPAAPPAVPDRLGAQAAAAVTIPIQPAPQES